MVPPTNPGGPSRTAELLADRAAGEVSAALARRQEEVVWRMVADAERAATASGRTHLIELDGALAGKTVVICPAPRAELH